MDNHYHVLQEAILRRDVVQFNQLLQMGVDIDGVDENGNSLLHIAALYNSYEIAHSLLQWSVSDGLTSIVNADRNTPLHVAVQYNNPRLTQLLLDYGISAYSKNINHQFPLHIAVRYAHLGVLQCLLLSYGKGVINLQDKNGNTPLHVAILHGHLNVARYLLAQRIYQDLNNIENNTALHFAAHYNQPDLIQLLLDQGADIGCKTVEGLLPLHIAAFYGHIDSVNLLTNHSTQSMLNAKTKYKATALYLAATKNHAGVVELLIKKGASINIQQGPYKYTALHIAAYNGCIEILKLLLSHPRKRHIKSKFMKKQPIHMAVHGGHIETVMCLLNSGVAVNAETDNQDTPLHLAVIEGNLPMVQVLIGQGADLYKINKDGNTVLHLAIRYGHLTIVKYLLQYDFSLAINNSQTNEAPLHMAVQSGNPKLVLFLLYKGMQLEAVTQLGYTALHLAAMRGNEEIVLLLLEHGISLNAKSVFSRQNTALHWAAYYGHVHIVDILLNKGHHNDQLAQRNAEGHTALHLAVLRGHAEVSTFLAIRQKSNLNVPDKQGNTPFSLAFQYYTPKMLPYIVFMLIFEAKRAQYTLNILNDSDQTCMRRLPLTECSALIIELKQLFFYWIEWRQMLARLRFSEYHLPSQQGAVNFWMRCTETEKKVLCFMVQSKWILNWTGITKNSKWVDLPLEIKQRVLYYTFQEKLNLFHPFQSYRSPSKWMAAAGSLITQLSFFKLGEVPISAKQNEKEAMHHEWAQQAEAYSCKLMSFYGIGR